MNTRAGLLLLVIGLTVVVAGSVMFARPPEPSVPLQSITHPASLDSCIAPELQDVIRQASRVEGILVSPDIDFRRPQNELIWEYPIRSAPLLLDTHRVRELRQLLLDRKSFQNERTLCEFMPNVDYRFIASGDTVDVLICHGCDEVVIGDGVLSGGGRMIPVGRKLDAISHAVFPNDSAITAVWRRGLNKPRGFEGAER